MGNNVLVENIPAGKTAEAAPKPEIVAPELPEKYRGKSLAELVEMNENAQRELGQRANEIGTWRGLIDDLMSTKRGADLAKGGVVAEPEPEPITSDALLSDPDAVIKRAVEAAARKAVAPLHAEVARTQRDAELEQLNSDFSNWPETAASTPFQAWVAKSRLRSADAQAAATGDLGKARRLLEDFTEYASATKPAEADPKPKSGKPEGLDGARRSATEGKGGGGDVPKDAEIITRDSVVKLINSDYNQYKSPHYQEKLRKAAKEGRLR